MRVSRVTDRNNTTWQVQLETGQHGKWSCIAKRDVRHWDSCAATLSTFDVGRPLLVVHVLDQHCNCSPHQHTDIDIPCVHAGSFP